MDDTLSYSRLEMVTFQGHSLHTELGLKPHSWFYFLSRGPRQEGPWSRGPSWSWVDVFLCPWKVLGADSGRSAGVLMVAVQAAAEALRVAPGAAAWGAAPWPSAVCVLLRPRGLQRHSRSTCHHLHLSSACLGKRRPHRVLLPGGGRGASCAASILLRGRRPHGQSGLARAHAARGTGGTDGDTAWLGRAPPPTEARARPHWGPCWPLDGGPRLLRAVPSSGAAVLVCRGQRQ